MHISWIKRWIVFAVVVALFIYVISDMRIWQQFLKFLFPNQSQVLYPGADLVTLVKQHLILVGISSAMTVLIGIPIGIWVTRQSGYDFLPLVITLTSFGQTFPPIAVLALAVPFLGFGLKPTVVALFLYGLLPVTRNTISGIMSVPSDTLEASYGIGLSRWQTLLKIELPLAAMVILAGIRISVIINVGTAMIGATIGAGGLGVPIVSGLVQNNVAYILEGAIPAAWLAILLDLFFSDLEKSIVYSTG